jgi:hypothetical protein
MTAKAIVWQFLHTPGIWKPATTAVSRPLQRNRA